MIRMRGAGYSFGDQQAAHPPTNLFTRETAPRGLPCLFESVNVSQKDIVTSFLAGAPDETPENKASPSPSGWPPANANEC